MPGRKKSARKSPSKVNQSQQKGSKKTRSQTGQQKSHKSKSHKSKSHKSKSHKSKNQGHNISKEELRNLKIIAYCMSCKSKNNMEKEGRKQNEKMNRMIQGMCCDCGGKVATILKKN